MTLETTKERNARGLCAVMYCTNPPVIFDRFFALYCQRCWDVSVIQNQPVKGRSSS